MGSVVALVVALAVLGAPASEGASRSAVPPGAVGAVTGRAHTSGRTPDAPRPALTGTAVVLVPRSEALLAELETIKRQARDSLVRYRSSIADIHRTREAYEEQLRAKGTPDLVRAVKVDAEGRFKIDDVPPGSWLLIAQHSEVVKAKAPRPPRAASSKRPEGQFLPQEQILGYRSVMVWLQEVTVEGGRAAVVDLTDRNGWFDGVEETNGPGTGRPRR